MLALAVAAALWALTGCGANFSAQTNQIYQPADGADYRQGDIYVVNALVVTDGQGNGTVVASLINQTKVDDALTKVSAVDDKGKALTAAAISPPVDLPPNAPGSAVDVSKTGAVRVSGASLTAGYYVTLTFDFENAEPVEIEVPVLDQGTIYASVPVGPATTASP